ncbi:MAG: DUF2089 family protein [Gemmatales bacterium]
MAMPAWLAALDEDDLQFLKRLLLASGSLKDLAESYEVSYPTVRNRLDRLIAKAKTADDEKLVDPFERRLKLLVADGQLSPNLAKELLTTHRSILNGRK